MPPPHRREQLHPIGEKARSALQRVQQVLNAELGDAPGYLTEDNVLCVSAHYRMVPPELQPRVHAAVERVLAINFYVTRNGVAIPTGRMARAAGAIQ